MPRNPASADERILLAQQTWENLEAFLDDLRDGKIGLRMAIKVVGGFAFSDAQRDPLLEVLQRNLEIEGVPIVVVKREDGSLVARAVVAGFRPLQ